MSHLFLRLLLPSILLLFGVLLFTQSILPTLPPPFASSTVFLSLLLCVFHLSVILILSQPPSFLPPLPPPSFSSSSPPCTQPHLGLLFPFSSILSVLLTLFPLFRPHSTFLDGWTYIRQTDGTTQPDT